MAFCLLPGWAFEKDRPSHQVWTVLQIGQLSKGVSEQQAKQTVISAIDDFMKQKIEFAGKDTLVVRQPLWHFTRCTWAWQLCAACACRPGARCAAAVKLGTFVVQALAATQPCLPALCYIHRWLDVWLAAADEVLVSYAVAKIYDGDVILTFGFSTTVLNVLLAAQKVSSLSVVYALHSSMIHALRRVQPLFAPPLLPILSLLLGVTQPQRLLSPCCT